MKLGTLSAQGPSQDPPMVVDSDTETLGKREGANKHEIYKMAFSCHNIFDLTILQLECVDEDFILCRSEQMVFRGQIPFEMRNITIGKDGLQTWISDVTTIRYSQFGTLSHSI